MVDVLLLLSLGGGEIFIIVIVILLLFGSKAIPDLAKGLGKGMKEFKKATDDIKKEINMDGEVIGTVKKVKHQIQETAQDIKSTINKSDILNDANQVKKNIDKK